MCLINIYFLINQLYLNLVNLSNRDFQANFPKTDNQQYLKRIFKSVNLKYDALRYFRKELLSPTKSNA